MMKKASRWVRQHPFFTWTSFLIAVLCIFGVFAANAPEQPGTRTGCTVNAINEPPSPRRPTLVKTTCGGLRSPDRAVTDSLQIGEVYDFDVIDRT